MKEKTKITIAAITCAAAVILICTGVFLFVNQDKIFDKPEKETTTDIIPETTTENTYMSGVDFNEYDISMSKLGNLIGNLNKENHGAVAYKGRREFHSVQNVGIYSFDVDNETSTLILGGEGEFNYQYLNVAGNNLYFINSTDGTLYTCSANGKNLKALAQNTESLFVYNDDIYYVSGDVYKMKADGTNQKLLMKKQNDEKFSFVGISNSRVYVSVKNQTYVKWYSININNPKDLMEFFKQTQIDEILYPQYTEGWFYFVKSNDLYRQKIGDEKTREILKNNVNEFTVKINCVYFGLKENGAYNTYEFNVNTDDTKLVLSTPLSDDNGSIESFIGTEYVYALGTVDGLGTPSYIRTCIFTAANVVMHYDFNTHKWSFN